MYENEFETNTVVLTDDEGNEQEFEILDSYEEGDDLYYALMPLYVNSEDLLSDDGELVVLKSVEENGEELLATIDSDEEYERIGNIFLERLTAEDDEEE